MALFCGQARYKMVSTKNKSEEKDIKLTVFYRKIVFFSSFCGNLINFVHVLLYNKVQIIRIRMENLASHLWRHSSRLRKFSKSILTNC